MPNTPGPMPATRKVLIPETTQVMTQVRKNGKTKLAYRAGSLDKPKKVVEFVGMARMVCANRHAWRRKEAAGKMPRLRTALL